MTDMVRRIGLDTNVLARYYVSRAPDDTAEQRQCALAIDLIDAGQPLAVCKAVLLELEWILRGYYRYESQAVRDAFKLRMQEKHVVR